MEKNQAAMSSSTVDSRPTAPPPSPTALPPTYEEAIAQSMAMTNPSLNAPPYPTVDTRLSITTPYAQPTVHIPQINRNDGPVCHEPQPPYNSLPPSYPITTEARATRQGGTYVLGHTPVKMQCPSCLTDIKTSTVSDHQPMAHICCLILCILGCCLCSCLPYCMSAFMTVHHFCPRCKVYIGTWKGFDASRRFISVRV
ncbi:hypothetical protein PV325_013125 [Microctonus aethiopoides]|uniref:LITAF domain-containing protein n=1 Tax=Microctonus aethiopoides TaxID=144406 RepID=A0AA39FM04_9HYME|nr:hypothetical protein PV325_013125 [Microctonus aethiopoides]KAK0098342.1 hypothetical protein PV326_009395 [Microctonus aethiopoides]KAK0171876.1 hypothetical protein PV328_005269 [Microctonus aethiopoides]